MNIFTKLLTIPASNETRQIEVAQLWEVRWTSRHGGYSHDVRPEVEAFTSKDAAEDFALALNNAWHLLRCSSAGTEISLKKAD